MKAFVTIMLAGASLTTLAFAQDVTQRSSVGTIKSLDSTTRMITLSDDSTYMAGKDAKLDNLKSGSMVWLDCDQATDGMSNCSVSSAAQGKVKSTDTTARTVTLDDGTVYTVPADMDLARIQTGSDVDFGFSETNGTRNLSSMTLAGEGKIQAIDSAKKTLTLEDGTEYSIGEGVVTDTFQPGADVRVSYDEASGKRTIRNIATSNK
jgi:Cu/Ag efflux protein CusF